MNVTEQSVKLVPDQSLTVLYKEKHDCNRYPSYWSQETEDETINFVKTSKPQKTAKTQKHAIAGKRVTEVRVRTL